MRLKHFFILVLLLILQAGTGLLAAGEVVSDNAGFSNGCAPQSYNTKGPPKNKIDLRHQLGARFRVVRRGSFLIASDLDEKRFTYLVDGVFACCRSILGREYFSRRPTDVVTVYIFKDRESYEKGLRKYFSMEPISPYGHYGHRQRYIVVNYATGPGTLVHELTHALMATDFPDAPIWISEGLASLYEQCKVEGESLLGEQNWRLPELKRSLKQGRTVPLAALFGSDTRMFRMMRESLNYAQSRYFCKYLEDKGLLRKIYREFRDHVKDDPTGIKTVERVVGKPIEEIDRDWRKWILKQSWTGEKTDGTAAGN